MIIKPKLLSLDTYHLSQMTDDFFSDDTIRKSKLIEFERRLTDSGYYVFLTFHHITELIDLKHKSNKLRRLNFLSRLPCAAWIRGAKDPIVGSIFDLMRHEVISKIQHWDMQTNELRAVVRDCHIMYGTGEEAAKDFLEYIDELSTHISNSSSRTREIVGISRSSFADINNTKLSDWIGKRLRSTEQTKSILKFFEEKLSSDITDRGDERIIDQRKVAQDFFDTVRNEYPSFIRGDSDYVRRFLLKSGLTQNDIKDENVKMSNLGDLLVFRNQISLVTKNFSPLHRLKSLNLSPFDLPSQIVGNALKKFGQSQPEWKGSELNDRNIASFAPYIDICCVDKRTHQDFNAASRKVPKLREMKLPIQKCSRYYDVKL